MTALKPKNKTLPRPQVEAIAKLFSVLGETSRLLLLQTLQDGPASVGELVEQLELKQANVSKQLGILYQAQLVDREREGNTVRYFIKDPIIFDICGVVCGKLERDAEKQLATLRGD